MKTSKTIVYAVDKTITQKIGDLKNLEDCDNIFRVATSSCAFDKEDLTAIVKAGSPESAAKTALYFFAGKIKPITIQLLDGKTIDILEPMASLGRPPSKVTQRRIRINTTINSETYLHLLTEGKKNGLATGQVIDAIVRDVKKQILKKGNQNE